MAAVDDSGLRRAFFLLTQVALAARAPDWEERLKGVGIALSPSDSILELTAAVQSSMDDWIEARGRHTDISDMAQQAACEALTSLASEEARTLFGAGRDELLTALHSLSTKAGFSRLSQRFFGGFLSRYLGFYLSRVTATGVGTAALPQLGDMARFEQTLRSHCNQTAWIVNEFSGAWFSKTEWERGINEGNTAGFVAVALHKLSAELQTQEGAR